MDGSTAIVGLISILLFLFFGKNQYQKNRRKKILNTYDVWGAIAKKRQRDKNKTDTKTRRKTRKTTIRHRKKLASLRTRSVKIGEKKSQEQPELKVQKTELQDRENTVISIENNAPASKDKESKLVMSSKDDTDRMDGVTYKTYLKIQQELEREKEKTKIVTKQQEDWDSSIVYGVPASLGKTIDTIAEWDSVFRELDQMIDFLPHNISQQSPERKISCKYRRLFRKKVDRAFSEQFLGIEALDKILGELESELSETFAKQRKYPLESFEEDHDFWVDLPKNSGNETINIEKFKKLLGLR